MCDETFIIDAMGFDQLSPAIEQLESQQSPHFSNSDSDLFSQTLSYGIMLEKLHNWYLEFYAKKLVPAETINEELQGLSSIFSLMRSSLLSFLPDDVKHAIKQLHPYLISSSTIGDMTNAAQCSHFSIQ